VPLQARVTLVPHDIARAQVRDQYNAVVALNHARTAQFDSSQNQREKQRQPGRIIRRSRAPFHFWAAPNSRSKNSLENRRHFIGILLKFRFPLNLVA
jgi:hypothetical protein